MRFKVYDCKLRLAGCVLNEVPKTGVTAPEIEVYRALHGADAVLNIREIGDVKRSDREEWDRLKAVFVNPNKMVDMTAKKKTAVLRDLFGHDRNPLPKEIEDAEPAGEVDEEVSAEPAVKPARTRVAKENAPAFAE